jgi:hypothetical protein
LRRGILTIDLDIEPAAAERLRLLAGQVERSGNCTAGGFGNTQVEDGRAANSANPALAELGLNGR